MLMYVRPKSESAVYIPVTHGMITNGNAGINLSKLLWVNPNALRRSTRLAPGKIIVKYFIRKVRSSQHTCFISRYTVFAGRVATHNTAVKAMSKSSIVSDVHASHVERMAKVIDELRISVPRLRLNYSLGGDEDLYYNRALDPSNNMEKLEDSIVSNCCTYFRIHCWRRYVNRGLVSGRDVRDGDFILEDHVPDMGDMELSIYNLVVQGLGLKISRPLPMTRPIIKLWKCRMGTMVVTAQMILPIISTTLAYVSGNVTRKYEEMIASTSIVFTNSTNKMGSSILYNNQRDTTCIRGVHTIDVLDYLNCERQVIGTPEVITLKQVNLACTRLVFKLNHIGGIILCTVSRRSLQIMERQYLEVKGAYAPMYFTHSSLKFTSGNNIKHKSVTKIDIYGSVSFTGDPTLAGACFSNMYECIAAVVKDEDSLRSFIGSLRVIQELRSDELASSSSRWT